MNYNFQIKKKNSKNQIEIINNQVMTKMKIILVFKIIKSKVKHSSKKQSKNPSVMSVQSNTKIQKNQWYNYTKKCADEIEQKTKAKKQVSFHKKKEVKNRIQSLG